MELSPSTITLQPFELSDAGDFLSWAGDNIVTRYRRWDSVASLVVAELHLRAVAIPYSWHRSICIGNHSIEYVSVKLGSSDERCRDRVSYAVGAEFWGEGVFVTAALRMVARSVFDKMLELVRLEAFVEAENGGSQRVLEKLSVAIAHPWRRSICIDDRSIGYDSVKPGSGEKRCRTSVGYTVGAEFWGWGFAMAALRMAARCVFDKMPELLRPEATQFYLDRMNGRILLSVHTAYI